MDSNTKKIQENKRIFIIENLKALRVFEYPNEDGIVFRYIKMTEAEAKSREDYCFHVLFRNENPKKQDLRFGFVYDFTTLLNENFFQFDAEVCYLPIVLKPDTWTQFLSRNKTKTVKGVDSYDSILYDITNQDQPGLIKFPLFKEEFQLIMKTYYKNNYLFVLDSVPSKMLTMRFNNFTSIPPHSVIFDESEKNRFYPTKRLGVTDLNDIKVTENEYPDIEENILKIQGYLSNDLKNIGFTKCEIYLKSSDVKKKMNQAFQNGADSTMVYSMIFNDAISHALSIIPILKKPKTTEKKTVNFKEEEEIEKIND